MECVLLGSGGMMPMPGRFLTSVVVRLQGQLYLFDAGEGCQINLGGDEDIASFPEIKNIN
jgi:ribonuclease Z